MIDEQAGRKIQHLRRYFSSLGELERKGEPTERAGQAVLSIVSAMVDALQFDRAVVLSGEAGGGYSPLVTHGLGILKEEPIAVPFAGEEDLVRVPRIRAIQSFPEDFQDCLGRQFGDWARSARAYLLVMHYGGEPVGLLAFRRAGGLRPLDEQEADLLCGMCQTIALQLHSRIGEFRLAESLRELNDLREETKELYLQTVLAFLTAIDIKDGYTKEHSLRVARMSSALAEEMGFSDHEVEGVYFAGLLHDIGKILVDKQILTKPGSLDLTEYAEMSQHSDLGAEIVSSIRFPWKNLIPTIRHHHDRPETASDDSEDRRCLATGVNIIGLTDAFDAMTSDRPYRRALTLYECIAEILNCLGEQFDRETTRVFLHILDREIARPNHKRSILTKELRNGNRERARKAIAEALACIDGASGVATAL